LYPVTTNISSMLFLSRISICLSNIVVSSDIGIRHFGIDSVNECNLVPFPAAKIIACKFTHPPRQIE